MRRLCCAAVLLTGVLGAGIRSDAQNPPMAPTTTDPGGSIQPVPEAVWSPWEFSLSGEVGVPSGHLKVGEPSPATRLDIRGDLGIDVAEKVDLSGRYSITPRDALRATVLYWFLDGTSTVSQPVLYNGHLLPPGRIHTDADILRVSLDYERLLLPLPHGGGLTASAGLTYVYFNPALNGNSEDFYRQELPVPIVGLRLDYVLVGRLSLLAAVSGGGLPRVDSLRSEGGTVDLEQSHVDATLGLAYAFTLALRADIGYQFTYFYQHEISHADTNEVELQEHGVRFALSYRF
jgi:hypothetical protein